MDLASRLVVLSIWQSLSTNPELMMNVGAVEEMLCM